ncbi:hypothetical protein [Polyangium jinanense]|uniref:Lipoprotein n=1 Tax=Polyangium jinanense TaxID=2829994 RepID=A0A9X3WXK9_9BACT|nr:hypothetical protein [Polyangium jinanense]MDC3952338.1 hypothetical protein [Polyangium jinanense]MDC3979967.1 hypothetical protein [Polyangium jinanense]
MNARASLMVVGLGLAVVGCAIPKPPPTAPDEYDYKFEHKKTGEPLSVEGESFTYTTTERVELGEEQIRDAQGRLVGSSRIYGNQQVAHRGYQWGVYQGRQPIDVLSALHIARDRAFEDAFEERIVEIRENHANSMSVYEKGIKEYSGKRSTGMIVAGVGYGIAGGWAIAAAVTKDDPLIPTGGSTAIIIGGVIVGAIGTWIYSAALGGMRREADKATAMANDKISPSDFPKLTTESYLHDVAREYNRGIAPEPPPPPKDTKKKKKK